jgi:hypothetical protein
MEFWFIEDYFNDYYDSAQTEYFHFKNYADALNQYIELVEYYKNRHNEEYEDYPEDQNSWSEEVEDDFSITFSTFVEDSFDASISLKKIIL